jgi:uncharacterized protein (DUF305 family)
MNAPLPSGLLPESLRAKRSNPHQGAQHEGDCFASLGMTGRSSLETALRATALAIALLAFGTPVLAQSTHTMPGMQMGTTPSPDDAASTKAYRDAMAKMNQGMAITYSGDADKDFVTGMIAHHQGAIDMAKVELQYGKDPQLHKLARGIIAAQQKEIAFMKSWQAKHTQ